MKVNIKSVKINGQFIDWMYINPLVDVNKGPKNIALIIPGNPGVVSYYAQFSEILFKNLNEKFAVWTVSHFGHNTKNVSTTALDSSCLLQEQIVSKVEFIRQYVPEDANVYLIGHSIGCYMILNMLEILKNESVYDSKPTVFDCIKYSYLLFPTIESMKATPNGKNLWPVLKYFRWFLVFLAYVLILVPQFMKNTLLNFKLRHYKKVDPYSYNATLQMVYPRILNNVLMLAYDELNTVTNLNVDLINHLKDKLFFYYGATDDWCPITYYNRLINSVPRVSAEVCKNNIKHAFVLESSDDMANILTEKIKCHR